MSLNADYIEPDLCLTKDNVFMVMHDLLLDDATDIIKFPEFADRVDTRFVDGLNMTGYFIDDFTQSELERLTLRQRISGRSLNFDGIYKIPSLSQVMNLAQKQYNITGRTVGVYAEIKHPSYYNSRHGTHFMEDLLLIALGEGGYAKNGTQVFNNLKDVVPMIIQSFELEPLKYLSTKTSLPLSYLMRANPKEGWTDEFITNLASYVQGIGPYKKQFSPSTMSFAVAKETIQRIQKANLIIHPYTFRKDVGILTEFKNDSKVEEIYFLCCLGVDGIFTEFPDQTREIITMMKFFGSKDRVEVGVNGDDLSAELQDMRTMCSIDCNLY